MEPLNRFERLLRGQLFGILPGTTLRLSDGAVEAMTNKIKSTCHRPFESRNEKRFVAGAYHCCARLPLPVER